MQIYTEKLFELDLEKMAAGFAGPYRTLGALLPPRLLAGVLRAEPRKPLGDAAGDASHRTCWPPAMRWPIAASSRPSWRRLRACSGAMIKGLDTDMDVADNAAKLAPRR